MKPPTRQTAAPADDAAAVGLPQPCPATDPATARVPRMPSTRWALASLSLTMLLSALGTSIANVGLPTLARHFDASFQQVQWVVLAYLLAITVLVVSVGRLGDLVGRRRLMLAGIGLYTLASVLCAVAPTLGLLIAARAVQGLGAAIMMVLTMALVGATVPKARTGSAMGLLGTMSAIGTALGPSMGGMLIAGFGWRSMFWLSLPLGLLAMGLVRRCITPDAPVAGGGTIRMDKTGSVLLALTLAAYALAMTLGRGDFGARNLALLLVAAVGLALFLQVEARAAAPLVRLALFREPVLRAGFAMGVLVMTVMMATLVVGPFYLAGALALDAAQVGLAMAFGPAIAAATGVPAGRIVDRFGARRMAVAGLLAMLSGSCLLFVLPTSLGVPGYILPLGLVTAGFALFQAANNTAVMAEVGTEQRGVVSGLLSLSRNLGLVTGASVMGAVFAIGSGAADVAVATPAAVAAGMRLAFEVAAVLLLLALAIAYTGGRVPRMAAGDRAGAGG
jgi:MFS family permease